MQYVILLLPPNNNILPPISITEGIANSFLTGEQKISDYIVSSNEKEGTVLVLKENEFYIKRTDIFEIIKKICS